MPTRVCARRRGHAHVRVHTLAQLCLRVYARIARTCTHRSDLARTYMQTWARSCPHVYADIGAIMTVIMPARIWRDHACTYMHM
jgi:hypothetical protein